MNTKSRKLPIWCTWQVNFCLSSKFPSRTHGHIRPKKSWMPHPWSCSRSCWMRPWATWPSGEHPCLWQGGWRQVIFKVPANPSPSAIEVSIGIEALLRKFALSGFWYIYLPNRRLNFCISLWCFVCIELSPQLLCQTSDSITQSIHQPVTWGMQHDVCWCRGRRGELLWVSWIAVNGS